MIPCANPSAQFQSHQAEIEDAVLRVMRGTRYVLGPEVEALEQEFASYIGTTDAIGVANGTDAIEIVLRAMGIGAGDEVITVSHTAVATVAGIEAAGDTPVLVDVEPDYYTMNPDQLAPGERCAATSNRNFEGRQGRGGRTHLLSHAMAAAAAITGNLTDVRDLMTSTV